MNKKARKANKTTDARKPVANTCSFHNFTPLEIDDLRRRLLSWYDSDQRSLPWRKVESSDRNVRAYAVWVSEVMLQQTQVATVIDYYNRWMKKWPTVQDLAAATVEEVNTMWSGLGYYSRGRSLLEGAQKVVRDMGGEIPHTAEDLQRLLPGVGRYTAGAIASIAFGQVTGLVDGNVMRVLARLRLMGAYITQKDVIDKFWCVSNQTVDPLRPGDYNQSVMELGATVCTPKTPACSRCPVRSLCHAYTKTDHDNRKTQLSLKTKTKLAGKVPEIPDIENTVPDCPLCLPVDQKWDASLGVVNLPRKPPKAKARQEDLYTLVLRRGRTAQQTAHQYWMVRRPEKGLLAGLWEFPVRSRSHPDSSKKAERVLVEDFAVDAKHAGSARDCGQVTHMFSHVHHTYHVIAADAILDGEGLPAGLNPEGRESRWISIDEMLEAAISTGMRKVFKLCQGQGSASNKQPSRKRPRQEDGKSKAQQASISSFFKPASSKSKQSQS